jgi:predicted ATP-grasp superfamily ATP-dependent carboligase
MAAVGKLPAILLGGAETAVPVCRSLGRGGVPVIAYGETEDPVRYSRYCTRYVEATGGTSIQEGWIERLLTEPTPGVLIPVSDQGVELVARNREALVAHGYVPIGDNDEAVLTMLDKSRTYEIAERAGVPMPSYSIMHSPADIGPALERVSMPCGIKPLEGHAFRERTGLYDKLIVAERREQFEELAGAWLRDGLGLMATEIIGGPDDLLYGVLTYLDEEGRPLFEFVNRKLRQDPPHFGVLAYGIQEDEPEVAELGLRLLAEAGFRGIACVEFKRDPRDARFKLIECNPRFYLGTEMVIASGLDVPLFAYRRACGEAVKRPVQRRKGVRLWHPLPDFRTMRAERRAGELTIAAWVRSLLHRQHFTLFAFDDPRPSMIVNFRTVARFLRKAIGRVLGHRLRKPPEPQPSESDA